jgi:hypothetical protein
MTGQEMFERLTPAQQYSFAVAADSVVRMLTAACNVNRYAEQQAVTNQYAEQHKEGAERNGDIDHKRDS